MNILKNIWTNLTKDPVPMIPTEEQKSALDRTLAAVINQRFVEWNLNDPSDVFLHPVINRAINLLAGNIAQLPLRIYKGDVEYKGDLPFDFERPNDYQSGYDFWMLAIAQRMVNNEIIIRKVLDGVRVSNLMLYDSLVAKEIINKNTGRITQWKLGKEVVPAEEVIHLPGIVLRGFRPIPLSEIVKNDFLADVKSSEFIRFFFENFSQLGGYLYYDGKDGLGPTPDQMQKLVEQINAAHQGSGKAYKLAGLTGGVKYDESGQSIKDMDFNLSKAAIRDRLLLHLGVHPSVVGVTDNVDRAVADTAMRALWQTTLKPIALQIESKLNNDPNIYKPFGLTCAWDFSDVEELKEDQLNKAELATKYLALGYSRNEINEKLQLEFENDPKYGEMQFIPFNLLPMDSLDEPMAEEPPEPAPRPKEADLDNLVDNVTKDIGIPKELKGFSRNFDKIQRENEKILRGKVKKHFFEQRSDCLKAILNHGSKDVTKYTLLQDIREIITDSTEAYKVIMEPLYKRIYEQGIELANSFLGIKGGTLDNLVIETRLNMLDSVDLMTYKQIRREIVESIKAGENLTLMADRVRKVFNECSVGRATTIARTESAALLNQSTYKRYEEGGVQFKYWGPPKERVSHAGNHAQGKIPFESVFQNGQSFPHDGVGGAAENVNCTCHLLPIKERDGE